MTRGIVVMACLVGAACAAAVDEKDKDPVKEKLFAAKVAYDKEMAQFRAQAGEWFEKREEAARKAGDKKALDQVKAEQKAFDEDGDLPKTAPAAIKQKSALAKKALEVAYGQAVKDYIKAKKDDQAATVEAEWKTFARGNVVDLLALVDPKAHAVIGDWKNDGKTLVCTSGEKQSALQLQYEPGEEYDIEVACRRLAGNECFAVGLVVGGHQVLAVTDGWPGAGFLSGLDRLDNKEAAGNVTTVKGGWLKTDKDNTITYSVRAGKIDVSVNGKVVTSFKGDFARLSLAEVNAVPNKKALFLYVGPHNTSFRIDRVMVTPVKGKGTILK